MSFRLGKFNNIPLTIHWSFSLLLLGIVSVVSITETIQTGILYGIGIIALFASVIIHEFMHSFVASRIGYGTDEIVLYPLGGMSKIEEIPTEPKQEFLIAFFGPLTNFIIAGIIFIGLEIFGPFGFSFLGRSFDTLIVYYIVLNIGLGLFNLLIPAIPMDGGRLLRSILATRMNFQKATKNAVYVSRIIAVIMGIIGFFRDPWLLLIAIFIYVASSAEMEQSLTNFILEDVSLSEIPISNVATTSPDVTVSNLLDRMLDIGRTSFLVTDALKELGVVTIGHIRSVDDNLRSETTVREIMDPEITSLQETATAKQAFRLLQENQISQIYVRDEEKIIGILKSSDLIKYVKIKSLTLSGRSDESIVSSIESNSSITSA